MFSVAIKAGYTGNATQTAAAATAAYTCTATANTNTITLNANGGTGTIKTTSAATITSSSQTTTFTCTTDSSMSLPAWNSSAGSNWQTNLANGKKRFLGWGTSASSTTADAPSKCPTGNTTYYAVWQDCSCTNCTASVSSNTCGGTCTTGYSTSGYLNAGTSASCSGASCACYARTYKVTLDPKLYASSSATTGTSATTAGTASYWYVFNSSSPSYFYKVEVASAADQVAANKLGSNGYTITKPTLTGYTFGGYYVGKTGTGNQYIDVNGGAINNLWSSTGTDGRKDITLYAKWTANTNTITLKKNGGTGTIKNSAGTTYTGTNDGSTTCVTDSSMSLPSWDSSASSNNKTNITNGLKRFLGWGTSASSTTANAPSTCPTGATTYHAVWSADCTCSHCTASVVNNACSGTCSAGYGNLTCTTTGCSCSGNTFNVAYSKGSLPTSVCGSTISGNNPSSPTSCTYGSTCTAPNIPYSATGYRVGGWTCSASTGSCASSTYTVNSSISTATTVAGNTITLGATWTAEQYDGAVYRNYDSSDTTSIGHINGASDSCDTPTYDAALPTMTSCVTVPSRTGYAFNGLYTARSGGTKYYKADLSANQTAWCLDAAAYLYAQWTQCSYTHASAAASSNPALCNGVCDAGYTGLTCNASGCTCSAATYTITLNDNGGSNGSGTAKEVYATKWTDANGTTITKVAIPTKTNNVFKGYYNSTTGTTQYVTAAGALPSNTTFTDNKTIYAQWTECTACAAQTGADCTLSVVNNACTYTTSCKAGYYNLQNAGAYNPKCDEIKVTTPTNHLTYNGTNGNNGTAQSCPGVTVTTPSTGNTITYATQTSGSCGTYGSSTPTRTDAGTTTVCYKVVTSDGNSKTGTYSCVMDKKDCTITLGATSGSTAYPTAKTTTVSTNGASSLTVSSSATSVATAAISNGTLTMTPAKQGTSTITVNSAASTNYNACSKAYALTVDRGTCVITLSPTSGSGTCASTTATFDIDWGTCNGTKGIASSATGVATAEFNNDKTKGTVTRVAAGSATITVSSAQTDQYNAASKTYAFTSSKVAGSTTVKKGTTAVANNGTVSGVYGTNDTLTATCAGGATPSVSSGTSAVASATISNGTITLTPAKQGTSVITVSCPATDCYNASTSTFTYSVGRADCTVSFTNGTLTGTSGTLTYAGSSTTGTFKASTTSNGALSVSSSNTNAATAAISNGTVTATWVGAGSGDSTASTNIVVTSAQTDQYNSCSKTYTLTTAKAACTVSLGATSGSTPYPTAKTTTVSTTSGGSLSATSGTSTVASAAISNGTLTMTPLKQGTSTITVTSAATSTYKSCSATYALTVDRGTCVITLSPTSGSGTCASTTATFDIDWGTCNGTKGIASSATGVATAEFNNDKTKGTVTRVAAGSATITVSSAQTDQYNAASKTYAFTSSKVAGSTTVKKGTTAVANNGTVSGVYGTNDTLTATCAGGATPSVSSGTSAVASATISNGTITLTPAKQGTSVITVSCPATDCYNASTSTFTYSVGRADCTVSFTNGTLTGTSGTLTYAGSSTTGTFKASTTSNGALSVSSSNTNAATAAISNGTVTATWVGAGSGDSTASTNIVVTSAQTDQYNSCSKTYTLTTAKAACTVTLSKTSDTTSYPASKTFTASTNTNGTLNVSPTSGSTEVALASLSNGTVTVTPQKTGTQTVTVSSSATTTYKSCSATYTLTVNNGTITCANTAAGCGNKTQTYNGNALGCSIAASAISPDGTRLEYATKSGSTCGTYSTTAPTSITNVADSKTICYRISKDNYTTLTGEYTCTITNATISASASNKTLTYNGTSTTNGTAQSCANVTVTSPSGASVTYSTSQNGTYTSAEPTLTNVGSTTVWYKVSKTNYTTTTAASYTCTMNAATPTYTKSNKSWTYDGNAHSCNGVTLTKPTDGTIKYSTTENGTYTTTVPSVTNVSDSKTIYFKVSGTNFNETAADSFTCNITRANGSTTFKDGSSTVTSGSTAFNGTKSLSVVCSESGTLTNNTVTSATQSVATVANTGNSVTLTSKSVGSSVITAECPQTANYNASTGTYTWTVAKGTISVTASNKSKTYDGSAQVCSISASAPGSTVTIKYRTASSGDYTLTSAPSVTNVADSKTVYYQVSAANYETVTGSIECNITRATMNPSANNNSKTYNGSALTCNGATWSNVPSGSTTYYSTDGGTTYNTTAPTRTAAGSQTINWKVTNPNYNDKTGTFTCTVNKADCGVTLSPTTGTVTYPTANTTFTATTASGCTLSVSPTATGTGIKAIASISNGTVTVTPKATGSQVVTVTATADGNHNNSSATYTLTINNKTININSNGGTGTCAGGSITCSYEAGTCTAPTWNSSTCAITNGTKMLLKWNTAANGSGTDVALGGDAKNVTGTLYAVWDDCTACATSTSANCALSVVNNTCTYTTSCKGGYGTLVNGGKYNPSCTQCAAGTASANGNNTCTTCENWKYSGAGASSCTSCPALDSGYAKLDSTSTGWTSYTKCVEIATASPSNCASGKLQKVASSDGATTWAAATVNSDNPLKANASYYVNGTSCSACSGLGGGLYTTSAANNVGGASACSVTVGGGKYLSASTSTTLSSCESGYWKAAHTLAYDATSTCSACPVVSSGVNASGSDDGSDSGSIIRDSNTDCYYTCPAKTISNGTATAVNAKVYYSGTSYPTCTYNVSCNNGYHASNNGTANPSCVGNSITINVNENGGSSVDNATCTYGGDLVLPSAPSKTGYSFAGWKSANGTVSAAGATITNGCISTYTGVTEGTSTGIRAEWTPNNYTVTLNDNTGTGGSGYVYTTYNTNAYKDSARTLVMSTNANAVAVPVHTNGHKFVGYYTSQVADDGTSLTTNRWIDENGYITAAGIAGLKAVSNNNVVLYARWVGCLPVTFDNVTYCGSNDNIPTLWKRRLSVNNQMAVHHYTTLANCVEITNNVNAYTPAIPANPKAHSDYIGDFVHYNNGAVPSVMSTNGNFTQNTDDNDLFGYTWYAHCTCDTGWEGAGSFVAGACTEGVTVALNDNTGTGGSGNVYTSKTGNSNAGVYKDFNRTTAMTTSANAVAVPTKANYEFLGYFSATTGGTKYIGADGKITSEGLAAGKGYGASDTNKVWYAQWKALNYTIALSGNGGTAGQNQLYTTYDVNVYKDSDRTLAMTSSANEVKATRTHYDFQGFYSAATGGTQYVNADGYITTAGLSAGKGYGDNSHTWYAQWTQHNYHVTYACGDGSGTPPTDNAGYVYNSTVTTKPNSCTAPSNATFSKWSCNGTLVNAGSTFTLTGDTACIAQWTCNDGYHESVTTLDGHASNIDYSLDGSSGSSNGNSYLATFTYGDVYVTGKAGVAASLYTVSATEPANGTAGCWCHVSQYNTYSMTTTPWVYIGGDTSECTAACGRYTRSGHLGIDDELLRKLLYNSQKVCQPNVIDLNWFDEDGTTPASGVSTEAESCTYGNPITLPTNPTKQGYRFTGWTIMDD